MNPIHVETTVEADGVLCIANLPCRKGDRVEATIAISRQTESDVRAAAKQRFLTRARQSNFSSSGRYPSREELHERD